MKDISPYLSIYLFISLMSAVVPQPQQLIIVSLFNFTFSSGGISRSQCGYLAFSIPRIFCHLYPSLMWEVVRILCIHCPWG